MNPFLAVCLFVLAVAAAFLLVSLALFWLVPLAFLVSFSFTQAMATAALMFLFGGITAAKG